MKHELQLHVFGRRLRCISHTRSKVIGRKDRAQLTGFGAYSCTCFSEWKTRTGTMGAITAPILQVLVIIWLQDNSKLLIYMYASYIQCRYMWLNDVFIFCSRIQVLSWLVHSSHFVHIWLIAGDTHFSQPVYKFFSWPPSCLLMIPFALGLWVSTSYSLRPIGVIRCYNTWPTLFQETIRCLRAPSHYQNQIWFISKGPVVFPGG